MDSEIILKEPSSEPAPHLHWNVPGQVDVRLVLVQPHFGHPQCIAPGVKTNVAVIRLLCPGNVSHPRAWQDLHTAPTQPNLASTHRQNFFLHCLYATHLIKHFNSQ